MEQDRPLTSKENALFKETIVIFPFVICYLFHDKLERCQICPPEFMQFGLEDEKDILNNLCCLLNNKMRIKMHINFIKLWHSRSLWWLLTSLWGILPLRRFLRTKSNLVVVSSTQCFQRGATWWGGPSQRCDSTNQLTGVRVFKEHRMLLYVCVDSPLYRGPMPQTNSWLFQKIWSLGPASRCAADGRPCTFGGGHWVE